MVNSPAEKHAVMLLNCQVWRVLRLEKFDRYRMRPAGFFARVEVRAKEFKNFLPFVLRSLNGEGSCTVPGKNKPPQQGGYTGVSSVRKTFRDVVPNEIGLSHRKVMWKAVNSGVQHDRVRKTRQCCELVSNTG